jgi:hypothetical protein
MPPPRIKFAINLNHEGSKSTQFDPKAIYSVSFVSLWLSIFRRAVGWFLPTALFALMPKCILCVVAYAGLGAALGLGRSEICGAPPGSWASSLAWLGGAGGLGTFGFLMSCRRGRSGRQRSKQALLTILLRPFFANATKGRQSYGGQADEHL